MADRRVDLVRRARIEQIALEATRAVLPEDAPRELHWRAMDAAEAAIAPRDGAPDQPAEVMAATARSVVAGICAEAGLSPRERGTA
ncbi:MAG TPA: hypothetical protein VGL20_03315 [Candidatus Dormibacteraeota bacterium]